MCAVPIGFFRAEKSLRLIIKLSPQYKKGTTRIPPPEKNVKEYLIRTKKLYKETFAEVFVSYIWYTDNAIEFS